MQESLVQTIIKEKKEWQYPMGKIEKTCPLCGVSFAPKRERIDDGYSSNDYSPLIPTIHIIGEEKVIEDLERNIFLRRKIIFNIETFYYNLLKTIREINPYIIRLEEKERKKK